MRKTLLIVRHLKWMFQKSYNSMLQHIGAPCKPCVVKGDTVKVGQIIGDSDKFISAPIHSSVSGTVTNVEPLLYRSVFVNSVVIETDGKQEVYEKITPLTFPTQKIL